MVLMDGVAMVISQCSCSSWIIVSRIALRCMYGALKKTVHSGFFLGGGYNSFGGIQRFICTLLLPRLSFVPLLFVSMCCHPPLPSSTAWSFCLDDVRWCVGCSCDVYCGGRSCLSVRAGLVSLHIREVPRRSHVSDRRVYFSLNLVFFSCRVSWRCGVRRGAFCRRCRLGRCR